MTAVLMPETLGLGGGSNQCRASLIRRDIRHDPPRARGDLSVKKSALCSSFRRRDTRAVARVFMSYRRDESSGHAGRLADRLRTHFGREQVFLDVDLAPGVEFAEHIRTAVAQCDALIVVIGPGWATVENPEGTRRRPPGRSARGLRRPGRRCSRACRRGFS